MVIQIHYGGDMIRTNNPRVTVIMSAYNHEKYVERAIESVLNQTYRDFVFLVADDCSTDSTREKILKYENEIDEIHFFDVNSGYGRNSFLEKLVKTEYIAMINSDDYWDERKMEKQVAYLDSHPECAACFTYVYTDDDNGNISPALHYDSGNRERHEWLRFFFDEGNHICHPSKMIRTKVNNTLRAKNNYNIYRQIPDFWMWIELVQDNDIYVIPERLTYFTEHNKTNMCAPTIENSYRYLVESSDMWKQEFCEMSSDLFFQAFGDRMVEAGPYDEIDVICEKFLLLIGKDIGSLQQAGIAFYHDIVRNPQIYQRLEEKYMYTNRDFYKDELDKGLGKMLIEMKKNRDEAVSLAQKCEMALEQFLDRQK